MDERLALLRAILAAPDDDVRRLAFADWLDENGTTDHDTARAEYIRQSCKLQNGKRPIQKVESGWLRENWRRLFPNFVSAAGSEPEVKWQGRYLTLHAVNMGTGYRLRAEIFVNIEFSRGFAARVRFKRAFTYRRFRDAVTDDDPVTVVGPYDQFPFSGIPVDGYVLVRPHDWGIDVLDRVTGFAEVTHGCKLFRAPPPHYETWKAQDAARDAVTAAMTAIAREANGLLPPPEPA